MTRRPSWNRRKLPHALFSVALILALVGAMAVLGTILYRVATAGDGRTAETIVSRPGTTATVSGTGTSEATGSGAALEIPVRPQEASSSSELEATNTSSYRATNLLDRDLTTAWIEGSTTLSGAGQWVLLTFAAPVTLARIEIANGNQKDAEHFEEYTRVRSLQIEYSNGSTQVVELLDAKKLQGITVEPASTEWLKLTVMSLYPEASQGHAALSDVRLFAVADQ